MYTINKIYGKNSNSKLNNNKERPKTTLIKLKTEYIGCLVIMIKDAQNIIKMQSILKMFIIVNQKSFTVIKLMSIL